MKIDIYDTYANTEDGKVIHFDVVVENGTSKEKAYEYALVFINSAKLNGVTLKQNKCNFCHSENADQESINLIKNNGFYIIPMEGCPNH